MSGDKYFPLTSFAVRIAGEPGWLLGELAETAEDAERTVRADGRQVLDFRVVSTGVGRRWTADGRPDVTGPDAWLFYTHGWFFDETAQMWRAPDEMIDRPAGDAPRRESIDVVDEAPQHGWWPVTVTAGDQTTLIEISSVYNPIDDLLRWIGDVAEKRDARVLIDCEGHYRHLIAFTESDDEVRFVIDALEEEDTRPIDVILPRKALVVSFMAALNRFLQVPMRWRDAKEGSYRIAETLSILDKAGYRG